MAFDPGPRAITARPLPPGPLALVKTATNNCVAVQMDWVTTNYPGTSLITSFGGVGEENLRAPASVAFGFATLLATGSHNPGITGYSDADLTATSVRLIESFANTHTANGGNWGGVSAGVIVPDHLTAEWQGALWVALAVAGARLLWPSLTAGLRTKVLAMATSEANRFLTYAPPYMRDSSGRVISQGDTKAEENAWQAWILYLAAGLMPEHANAAAWLIKGTELSISATATPAAPTSKRKYNGISSFAMKAGSNIDLNGMVENHSILSPNYVSSLGMNWMNGLSFAWLRGVIPTAPLANAELIYRALTDVSFSSPPQLAPGGTIYTPGLPDVYYPAGAEGDSNRMAGYVAMDAMAYCIRADAASTIKADTWLTLHAQKQVDMQAANSTSRRSYWDLQNGAWALLASWLGAGQPATSNAGVQALLAP